MLAGTRLLWVGGLNKYMVAFKLRSSVNTAEVTKPRIVSESVGIIAYSWNERGQGTRVRGNGALFAATGE